MLTRSSRWINDFSKNTYPIIIQNSIRYIICLMALYEQCGCRSFSARGAYQFPKSAALNVQVCLSKTESISTHKSKRNPDFSGNLIISSYMGASGLGFIGMFSQATAVRSPILNYGLTRPKHMCGVCKPSTRK